MDDDLDAALETAAERTRQAEERLRAKPLESPAVVEEAHAVERRAEDVHVLAQDAATDAERQAPDND